MQRGLAQSVCFTRFLIERDALSLAVSRIGNGFSPPSVLAEAKHHLNNIAALIKEFEVMARPQNQSHQNRNLQSFVVPTLYDKRGECK